MAVSVDHQQCEIRGLNLKILPERAVWIQELKTLLLSDLHLGKANHFRRSGIPVPRQVNDANTETLLQLLMQYQPGRTIFLGDLFHSHYNQEWEVLGQVVSAFPETVFDLVTGNHDILSQHQYERNRINQHQHYALTPEILLTHIPEVERTIKPYQICGHLHPAVTLRGKGRQSITLPCFWFGVSVGILPAFGAFTGMKRIEPVEGDQIFVVADKKIIRY
ncbi:MAG: ligase-associated DNA damage response endonuclease PdeM [Bacteroidetes bacterium]|nr:ligase-associated DNA damage response endonuclease PdeM [Bacteroidota bacterium]